MGVNNFKKLEDLELGNLSMRTDLIKSKISSNLGSIRFLTDIVELYFPKVVGLFLGMTGADPNHIEDTDRPSSKYPDMR